MRLLIRLTRVIVYMINVKLQLEKLGCQEMGYLEKIVLRKMEVPIVSNLQKSNGMDHYYILTVRKPVDTIQCFEKFRCHLQSICFSDYCDERSRSIYHPSYNSPENVLETNNEPETEESSWNPPRWSQRYFIMDMGCPHTFENILVKNSHNHENRDESSKKLK